MRFPQHLHEFLGDSVDDTESRDIAMAVIARTIRSLKIAIAERLWLARQASHQENQSVSSEHLSAARSLKEQYESARAEYESAANPSTRRATERCPQRHQEAPAEHVEAVVEGPVERRNGK